MPFTPHDAALDALDRAKALLAGSIRPRSAVSGPVRSDMRRLSIVMAVAALDTYMHRLIVARVYEHDVLPNGLARLDVRFDSLLEQADGWAAAARAAQHQPRPRVAVKRLLRDRLLRETFQSYEDVSKALGMAGLSGNWTAIGGQMTPVLQPQDIRSGLNAIVQRRNQVVHEGDYERLEKPRSARRNGVSVASARSDIEFITQLVNAIHVVS